jgi:XapX domain-containing protein
MKVLLNSFVVGLLVGIVYGVIRVRSPAPPIFALLGLLGMVSGERAAGLLLAKKAHRHEPNVDLQTSERKAASLASREVPSMNRGQQ